MVGQISAEPGRRGFGARSIFTKWFPNNRFSSQHLLHIGRDMTQPFVAGLVSSAASMMPRPVIKEVGYLDVQFFYHVDADYCKRIADAGYKCYYLPTGAIIHLNHKGGTMPESIGAFSVVDDVRNLELSVLSQAHPDIVVDPDADRRHGRALVSFFGVGVRASLRRAPRDCTGRISCQKAGGSLIASREPKALEDIAEQSFAPQRGPERFVWFHTTYDDHSLSVGPLTPRVPAKAFYPVAVFVLLGSCSGSGRRLAPKGSRPDRPGSLPVDICHGGNSRALKIGFGRTWPESWLGVTLRGGPQGPALAAEVSAARAGHFAVDLDQVDEAVDAEVGEGHDAFVSEAQHPDEAVLRLHFDGDVEEEVDVLAEVFGDAVDGPDAVDLVDVHGSGRQRCNRLKLRPPVPGQQFIEPMRGMAGDAREDVGEPRLRIDAVHLCRDDEAVHGCGAPASAVGPAEQP